MSSIRQKPGPFRLIKPDSFGLNEPDPFGFYETQPLQKFQICNPPQPLLYKHEENTNQTHEATRPPALATTTGMNNQNHHDPYDDERSGRASKED
ncbi:hypothetical protein MTR_5g029875 [Medicago truncatula]|uniref:Uncharacterized protein n=1 Tax=Medicago truncatula TaxID=3880 RepID=A0A072UD35_MEDTR|nr:hypothetical protein MTR_5g029875 [Medicago truncatula]